MASNWRTKVASLLGSGKGERGEDRVDLAGDPAHAQPAPDRVTGPDQPLSSPKPQDRTPARREAGEPVLIVDDDRDWCLECAFSLRQLGYDPLVAHGPADAMALFLENDVAIAIVDYHLPEGDGISLIHALSRKAEEQARSLSFIMATGHATKDIAIDAVRAAVTDFLEKPITQAQLRGALQRIKGLRPSAPAREALLDKISDLSSELQRIALLIDHPAPEPDFPDPPASDPEGGAVDPSRLNAFIRDQLRREAKRREIGGGELFGDPTWAMLLDLLLARMEGRRISVSSACIASGAPMSTALRLVRRLVGEDVLCRLPDEHDRRRHFLVINPRFEQPLLDYIAEQVRQNKA
jgi:FixJ family two-component response regulator